MKRIILILVNLITLSIYAANNDESQKNFIASALELMRQVKAKNTFTLPSHHITGLQLQRLRAILYDWYFNKITPTDAQTRINDNYRATGLIHGPNTPDHPTLTPHKTAPLPVTAPATTAVKPPVAPATICANTVMDKSVRNVGDFMPRAQKKLTAAYKKRPRLRLSASEHVMLTLPESQFTGPQLHRFETILDHWASLTITSDEAQKRIDDNYRSKDLPDKLFPVQHLGYINQSATFKDLVESPEPLRSAFVRVNGAREIIKLVPLKLLIPHSTHYPHNS